MELRFPDHFFFGTSTSAAQIETAFRHDWEGIKALDGNTFVRTTDHELRFEEDARLISELAPTYRMSLLWSELQKEPFSAFDDGAVKRYRQFLALLHQRGVRVMMVLHHWCNPLWFSESGGWTRKENIPAFVDYCSRVADLFGQEISWWNTFNEPNLYVTFAYLLGEFPPYSKSFQKAVSAAQNMAEAHTRVAAILKARFPKVPVGVSHNTVAFSADNFLGEVPAFLASRWYHDFLPGLFHDCDYTGISYYARLAFDPRPVSFLRRPKKFSSCRPHDDIWEYYPYGLTGVVRRFSTKFCKPVIITENGVCTSDDSKRENAIRDYMGVIHELLTDSVDIAGYFHWTTWDNFEWTLGPSYKFGLCECDRETMERKKKPSAELYAKLAHEKVIEIRRSLH